MPGAPKKIIIFFRDKLHFSLSGYVNKHSCGVRDLRNPEMSGYYIVMKLEMVFLKMIYKSSKNIIRINKNIATTSI